MRTSPSGIRVSTVAVAVFSCSILAAQISTRSVTTQQSPAADSSKIGQFSDKNLDVYFNYPVEMRALDGRSEMESGHFNIFGSSGENDPEHQEAKRCIKPLLDLDLPLDKAPARKASMQDVWVDDSKEYKESSKPQPIFGKIFLIEFSQECVTKQMRKRVDDTLGSIALSFVSLPGIQKMPQPIWYEIGKQKVHMNSGAGRPIVNGKLDPAPMLIMAMSTDWHGHILAWAFTSNDTEVFNELTKSLVRFGDGPWSPMFAPNIGPKNQGTPMTILPR
jgi:hypothetical protein